MKVLKYSVLSLVFMKTSLSFAQQNTNGPIVIMTTGQREIEPAYRLIEGPKIMDTVFPTPSVNYPLLAINYEPTVAIQAIAPATINITQKLPQLYKSYLKVGIGSIMMPMGEFYFNNARTRKFNYGIHAQHLSSFGPIKDYAPASFDRTALRGFVGMNERKFNWNAEAFYKNQGLHYYGFRSPKANADSIAQRYQTAGFRGSFTNHQHDSLGINWIGNIEYRHFNDKKPEADSLQEWNSNENYFTLFGGAWMRWGNEILSADADLKYNGYKHGIDGDTLAFAQDSGIFYQNTTFSLRPAITTYSKNGRFKAKLGIDLTIAGGTANPQAYLYPNMEAKYSLFDDILIPYAQFVGGLTQQSYYNLTSQNEFILSNVNLKNESKTAEILGGIKGTVSKRIGFNVFASFSNVKDRALFVTDTTFSAGNKFKVIYETMNIAKIEGSLNYQFMEKIKIDLIGRFYSYQAVNNIFAWNLPQLEFVARGSYNLYDKFILNMDATVQTGRRALVYAAGTDVIEENNQFAKKLGAIVDVNLGFEYRYNNRVSGFVRLNNLAAQRYQRWYNYPVQGFQAMIGATFRF